MPASIVLASRLEDADAPVARVAARLAGTPGDEVVVVYVATELETAPTVSASAGLEEAGVREQMVREAEARALDFVRRHLPGGNVRVRVLEGPVVESVVRAAGNADFLVVGSHRREALLELVAGDTAHDLIRHAPCPVVVVPI